MTVATSAISADPMLERITRTIVEQFRPQRIVLFGSRARGDARPDSDYDVVVELEIAESEWKTEWAIRGACRPLACELDIHARAPGALERRRDDPGWLDYDMAREGIVLYAAEGVSASIRPPSRVREQPREEWESVGEWLEQARRDFLAAEQLMPQQQALWDRIAFHVPQAAEKSLKALVVTRGFKPARTHDLTELLAAARSAGCLLPGLDGDCALLTPYAVDSRYPSKLAIPTEQKGRELVEAARRIVAAVAAARKR